MNVYQSVLALLLGATFVSCAQDQRLALTPPVNLVGGHEQLVRPLGQLSIRNADPSVIRVGSTYVSTEVSGGRLYVRQASSISGLASAAAKQVWGNPNGWAEVWAPDIVLDHGVYYIYFAAGAGSAHRMYVISSGSADSGYSSAQLLALPDNKWAIDGVSFLWNGGRYFVWSGWQGDTNVEQNIYIARMSSPTSVTGPRYIISQPREWWERNDSPYINEGPQPIKDPNGQLHIVYSANGSWGENYCLADLRLRAGGDLTYVWDYYKSNGCLFGFKQNLMMNGWDSTLYAKGVGHHSFGLLYGDIAYSPSAGTRAPFAYHGVPKNDYPNPFWNGRYWYEGSYTWWGNTTYTRGTASNTGYSLKFFE